MHGQDAALELNLVHPAPGRRVSFTGPGPIYEAREADRRRRGRESGPTFGPSPCSRIQSVDIEMWPQGADLFVDGQRVASGSFEMRTKDQIDGEVALTGHTLPHP